MNLLRYYFKVGGENFDAQEFSIAATKNGFVGGKHRVTNNWKTLTRYPTGEKSTHKILSGITGTNGDTYAWWDTARMHYATDRNIYMTNLGMATEWAQTWQREEEAILSFLQLIKDRLPVVGDFCKGEHFLFLKLIYGYGESDKPGGCAHYSDALMKKLCELNAGLSCESNSFEMHFDLLESEANKKHKHKG